jgi:hypothetical protein
MKKTIKQTAVFLALICLISIFSLSCENTIALGARLDINGPVVTITTPVPRKAISREFVLGGDISDKTGVKELSVKASINNEHISRQWRYKNGVWEISLNAGETWELIEENENNLWLGIEGSKTDWIWSVNINMGDDPKDGEYLFYVQAWDSSGQSDDNSFKTIVVIIDQDPPKVSISNPYLYDRYARYVSGDNTFAAKLSGTEDEIAELTVHHQWADLSGKWKDPTKIGKFLTQEFLMQWQIEDNHDIWSFDLRFYDIKEPTLIIDEYAPTPLSEEYIYRYVKNDLPPPDAPQPDNYLKANESVMVPALTSSAGAKTYKKDGKDTYAGEIKKPITEKTTIVVVSVCYDAAGNANQEKILGYFIYWPLADTPWIEFSGDLKDPSAAPTADPDNETAMDALKAQVFMIYPGRDISAIAYHAQGVQRVEYKIYTYNTLTRAETLLTDPGEPLINPPRGNNILSNSFSWSFRPTPRSAFYVVRAFAYSLNNVSEETAVLFRVQYITFPDFPDPPSPSASSPLFESIVTGTDPEGKDSTITISGIVWTRLK